MQVHFIGSICSRVAANDLPSGTIKKRTADAGVQALVCALAGPKDRLHLLPWRIGVSHRSRRPPNGPGWGLNSNIRGSSSSVTFPI